jgi:GTP-binding protein
MLRYSEAYRKEMLKQWDELPPIFTTSAESKFGKENLLNYIGEINDELAKK